MFPIFAVYNATATLPIGTLSSTKTTPCKQNVFSVASERTEQILYSKFSFYILFLILLQLYCPNRISPMGNSGCFPRGKPAVTESRFPTYDACWVFQCFHNPPNSDMDHRIFYERTYFNACDCTQGGTDTLRESVLMLTLGEKSLAALGK